MHHRFMCLLLQDRKKSLFSAGIIKVDGEFEAQVRPRVFE